MTVNTVMEKAPLLINDSSKSSKKVTKSTIEHTVVLIAQPRLAVESAEKTPKTLENGRTITRYCTLSADQCYTICFSILGCVCCAGIIAGIVAGIVWLATPGKEIHPNECDKIEILTKQLVNSSSVFLQNSLEDELAKRDVTLFLQPIISSFSQALTPALASGYAWCSTKHDWVDCFQLLDYFILGFRSAKPLITQSITITLDLANITLSPADQAQLINAQINHLCQIENEHKNGCDLDDLCKWVNYTGPV